MTAAHGPLWSRLQEAHDRQDIVSVSRRIRGADDVEGIVVGLSKQWLLIHEVLDGVRLNGYLALRIGDVRSVDVSGDQSSFSWRALRHYRQEPAPPQGVDLTTTRTLVETAAREFPLIVISLDVVNPSAVWIGAPMKITSRSLHLRGVYRDGSWDDASDLFPLRDITAVGFGGMYETALHEVGGE